MHVSQPDALSAASAGFLKRLDAFQLAGVHVVIVTTFELDEYVARAVRAGAAGFLVKDTEPADLVRAGAPIEHARYRGRVVHRRHYVRHRYYPRRYRYGYNPGLAIAGAVLGGIAAAGATYNEFNGQGRPPEMSTSATLDGRDRPPAV